MLKRLILSLFFMANVLFAVADDFRFDHGPYIQNLSGEGVTIYFTTSRRAFSWVEVKCDAWSEPRCFYTVRDGLVEAYGTRNAIRITGLEAGREYSYRLVAKEMKEFRPYKIVYGDSITSQWERFGTLPESIDRCSFVVINDGHDDASKVRRLLGHSALDGADAVFYLGDMVSHIEAADVPYKGFIDVSVELFARNKPFVAVRGNHETRGNLGRTFGEYVGRPEGKFYGIYYYGSTAVIVLDTGEDKPDAHPVYGGINRFDDYRREQARWLGEQMKSKRFRKARNKIVLMHIPPIIPGEDNSPEGHAVKELNALFVPLFNKAGVDLVLSGHTHRHFFVDKGTADNKFPLVINNNKSVIDLSVEGENINVKITDEKGQITFDQNF